MLLSLAGPPGIPLPGLGGRGQPITPGSQAQLLRPIAARHSLPACLCPACRDQAWRGPKQFRRWQYQGECRSRVVSKGEGEMMITKCKALIMTPSLRSCHPSSHPSFCALSIWPSYCHLFLLYYGPVLTLPYNHVPPSVFCAKQPPAGTCLTCLPRRDRPQTSLLSTSCAL